MITFDEEEKKFGEKILRRRIAGLNEIQREEFLEKYADYILELEDIDFLMRKSDDEYFVMSEEKIRKPVMDRYFGEDLIFADEVRIEKIKSYN